MNLFEFIKQVSNKEIEQIYVLEKDTKSYKLTKSNIKNIGLDQEFFLDKESMLKVKAQLRFYKFKKHKLYFLPFLKALFILKNFLNKDQLAFLKEIKKEVIEKELKSKNMAIKNAKQTYEEKITKLTNEITNLKEELYNIVIE
jgi:hypothetical protein